jgi:hypothetical protein
MGGGHEAGQVQRVEGYVGDFEQIMFTVKYP